MPLGRDHLPFLTSPSFLTEILIPAESWIQIQGGNMQDPDRAKSPGSGLQRFLHIFLRITEERHHRIRKRTGTNGNN
jgi:hypothetical protein